MYKKRAAKFDTLPLGPLAPLVVIEKFSKILHIVWRRYGYSGSLFLVGVIHGCIRHGLTLFLSVVTCLHEGLQKIYSALTHEASRREASKS